MTKRKFAYLLVFAILLIGIYSLFIHPHEMWREIVYQHYKYSWGRVIGVARIKAWAKASLPANFSRDMSKKTIGDSSIFQVDDDLRRQPGSSSLLLPYPPVEVYCVVVDELMDDQTAFYFVALHSDGQHSDWVMHTPNSSWKGIRTLMDRIGCDIARY